MSQAETTEAREQGVPLGRALEQLEEQRVAAIELRMLLDASEARLQSMAVELETARAAARQAEEQAETARVEAIELRVILDATEHRAERLQQDIEGVRRDAEAAGAERVRLEAEVTHSRDERRVMEAMLQEARLKLEEAERVRGELGRLQARFGDEASSAESTRAELRARLTELEMRAARFELEAMKATNEVDNLRRRAEELEETNARLEREAAEVRDDGEAERLQRENEQLRRRLADLERDLAEATGARLEEPASAPAPRRGPEPSAAAKSQEEDIPPLLRLEAGPELPEVTLVHLDDQPDHRDAVRAMVAEFPSVRYLGAEEVADTVRAPGMLVVNLLAAGADALAAVSACERWGLPDPCALTYCADAGRGVILGMLDFFPAPFDADACATRLLEREGTVQRLLMVSDNIDLTNSIRATMGRFQVSTSVALDSRQAFELAVLVRPDYVLVDLSLPRGEGLRLVAKLGSDAKTAAMPVALLWGEPIEASDLRTHAARLARETPLGAAEIQRAVQRELLERARAGAGRR